VCDGACEGVPVGITLGDLEGIFVGVSVGWHVGVGACLQQITTKYQVSVSKIFSIHCVQFRMLYGYIPSVPLVSAIGGMVIGGRISLNVHASLSQYASNPFLESR
jgi:hypothetical protein